MLSASAKGEDGYDYVSRLFAPKLGLPEDPATGSSHCMIAPYWGNVLNKRLFVHIRLPKEGEVWSGAYPIMAELI